MGGPGAAAFRHRHLPDHVVGAWLGDSGWSEISGAGLEGFSERNSSAPAPTAAVPAGVVALMGALLWVPSPHQGSG